MRRTGILIAIAAALLAAIAEAAAAATPVPRATLTNVEYREFLAVQKAARHIPKSHNPTVMARRWCRGLTNISSLTSTQHVECKASAVFVWDVLGYTNHIEKCAKAATQPGILRCFIRVTDSVYRATEAFFRDDVASLKVAKARGFSGRCLDYLVLTPDQKRPMHRLARSLFAFSAAISIGDGAAVKRIGTRLDADVSATLKSFTGGSVTVCRHQ